MAGLIKSQILKHLSKFAKNLSHDQIHLSALKGEGELKNLELNEEVLTELLELPSWLRLSGATCNRVAVRIQWTKLKSVPIHLSLDEVRVEVETCENLRPMANNSNAKGMAASYASGGQYGFSDKVVDGITLTVNSVILTLKSHAFIASFQMSRIVLESKSPTWQKSDLRMTRVKDTDRGELLIFKELSWQTVRIEAKSTMSEDLTPLRLITNQARCRITIKKKLSDCAVLGCRLVLIMEDLLWVLTDDQLKAALHFADSLTGLLKRATEESQKIKGARKLESLSENQGQTKDKKSRKKGAQTENVAAKVFARYDVVETSYHFYSDRIDLHLCDDPGGKGRSCHPDLSGGGAFQVSLSQLQLDFYPYHLAIGDRSTWIRYQPETTVHTGWLENSLKQFQTTLLDSIKDFSPSNGSKGSSHAPLSRAGLQNSNSSLPNTTKGDSNVADVLVTQFRKLMTTNLVVRLNNFTMWKVSTSKVKMAPREFLSGEREKFSLPDDMPVMHFEYTQFYYPGNMEFPLPPPKMFAYFNPIQLSVDPITMLWLNAFALNLQRSVKMLSVEQTDPPYLDVKIEAIMFRVIIEAIEEPHHPQQQQRQKDRPQALHVQASRILCANYRSLETGSKADLAKCLENFQESTLFFGTEFPNLGTDIPVVCDKYVQHATENFRGISSTLNSLDVIECKNSQGGDNRTTKPSTTTNTKNIADANNQQKYQELWPVMKKDLLWTEAKDVWYVHVDPLWADFHGTPATGNRPIPFIDAFPATLWLYKQEESGSSGPGGQTGTSTGSKPISKPPPLPPRGKSTNALPINNKMNNKSEIVPNIAKMHLLLHITNLVSVQLNHYQFLFLMRLLETVSEITTFLTQDVSHILGEADESSMALGLIIPQVDLSLLMPSITQCNNDTTTPIGGEDSLENSMDQLTVTSAFSVGDLDRADTPQNTLLTVESAPVSPSRSLPNANSVPNLPQQTSSGAFNMPKPATPTIHLTTPLNATKGNAGKKNSLTSSLTNMMTQLDASIRGSPVNSATTPTSEEDLLSVKSDDSDADSEAFVMINQVAEDSARDNTLFAITSKRASPVEVAAEAVEESAAPVIYASSSDLKNNQTTTPKSSSNIASVAPPPPQIPPPIAKEEGVISVATFHLGQLQLSQQSIGSQACIKLQASSLSGEECPAISWEEFQSKFTCRSKGWSESTRNQMPSSWVVKLRVATVAPNYQDMMKNSTTLGMTTMSLREKISRATDVFVDVKVQNLPLQFYLSTLDGLADLFEDEIIPTPIPMKIQLENLALHLVEDRPSKNISSPGSLPIDLAIPSLFVTRDKSGLFSLQPTNANTNTIMGSSQHSNAHASIPEVKRRSTSGGSEEDHGGSSSHMDLVRSGVASIEEELQQRASLLAVDNANLRSIVEQSNAQLHSLRCKVSEFDQTQKKLVKMQQRLLAMEKENKRLGETNNYLQQELVKSGKKIVITSASGHGSGDGHGGGAGGAGSSNPVGGTPPVKTPHP